MKETFLFSVFPVDNKSLPLIGRDEEIYKIKQHILEGCNISIIGDTKIGKTSILKTIESDFLDLKYIDRVIPVYINFEKFAYNITGEMLLDKILRMVYRSCDVLKNEFNDCTYDKANEFSEVVEFCMLENIIILLLFDNFDSIPILKKLDNAFWTHLRGNAESKELSIVTASRSSIETLCHKGDLSNSHFWNNFDPIISLSVLEDIKHAKNILLRGITNERNIDLIISLVGVHPFFIKLAANALIENKLIESDNVKEIESIIYEKIKPFYKNCLKLLQIDDDNIDNGIHYKLEYISTLNSILTTKINDTNEKREIKNLKQLGYVNSNSDGFLEISSPLFERYLKDLFNDNKVPESYKGNNPYIFISYAHTDSKIVYPLIEKLQEVGFRVWYDEGIPISAKWKKEIEQRIKKSEKFIFFLSKDSCLSNEVNIELQNYITFSGIKSYKNDFIMIVLDEIKICKNESTCEYVDFVVSDCNGLHISKNDDSYFAKLSDKLGFECKD